MDFEKLIPLLAGNNNLLELLPELLRLFGNAPKGTDETKVGQGAKQNEPSVATKSDLDRYYSEAYRGGEAYKGSQSIPNATAATPSPPPFDMAKVVEYLPLLMPLLNKKDKQQITTYQLFPIYEIVNDNIGFSMHKFLSTPEAITTKNA